MPHSISTLLTRNLQEVFGENYPVRRRAAIDELYTEDCVFYDPSKGVYRGRDEIDRIAGAIKVLTLTFDISQSPSPRKWAMAGGSHGYRAALVRRQLTPGLISSLPATAELPPYISSSTSFPDLASLVRDPLLHTGPASSTISPLLHLNRPCTSPQHTRQAQRAKSKRLSSHVFPRSSVDAFHQKGLTYAIGPME